MKALAYLLLCLAPMAMASAGQSDAPVPGKVTLVCLVRPMQTAHTSPATEADTAADIALKKDQRGRSGYGGVAGGRGHSPSGREGVQSRRQSRR